jgi:diguanylate cyclase (GGDEF)-like protein
MSRRANPDRHRTGRLAVRAGCALAGLVAACAAHAACLDSVDPAGPDLTALVVRDPRAALSAAEAAINDLKSAGPANAHRLAALYAIMAQSYSALELDAEARQAASSGLALAPDHRDPVHVDLMTAYAANVYDEAGIDQALATIQAERAEQPAGSAADICLLVTLGGLQHRADREAQAVVSLIQAYRASGDERLARQRAAAAETLAVVMRGAGDYSQALALNGEAIDWDTAHGALLNLSVNRYLRGGILSAEHAYPEAIREFSLARALSERLGDAQGVAFADMSVCEAQIELGSLAAARDQCDAAARVFAAANSNDVLKRTRTLLARIDLEEGHAAAALALLDAVMDKGGADLPPRQQTGIYKLRAQARAALHDYRAAYIDLSEYLRRITTEQDLDRALQSTVQRVRFETDREIARNGSLERELASSEQNAERRQHELHWTIGLVAVSAFAAALLAYLLFVNVRFRRELTRHANYDGLTGLPNRRHTTELATAALRASAEQGKPVTFGLIDLDHFKAINDRGGHAVGDFVLTQFAAAARAMLREHDAIGRWGGEEFLLILPDTALDAAMAVTDRLRAAALAIALPPAAEGLRVSFSAGLATRTATTASLDEIIACADAALYDAKQSGRDTVRIDTQSGVPPAVTPPPRAAGGRA